MRDRWLSLYQQPVSPVKKSKSTGDVAGKAGVTAEEASAASTSPNATSGPELIDDGVITCVEFEPISEGGKVEKDMSKDIL